MIGMLENDYLPIQSLDIEAESKITFDVYVNLPLNQKYVLYRKKGGHLEGDKLANLSSNNVKNLFIHRSDYNEFVKYAANRIKNLMSSSRDPAEKRKVMLAAAKSILSSTIGENNPAVTGAFISNLNDITTMIIGSVLESSTTYNKKMFQKFIDIAQKGTDFQKHPVNVASLAVMMTFGIGYDSERILSDVAMASLLHDIGLSKLPTSLIARAHQLDGMTPVERESVYQHPQYALDILLEKNVQLPELAKLIIMQHHEEFNGFGYPKGIRGYHLNELAQILKVADELDLIISEGHHSNISIKNKVSQLMDRLYKEKIIEPTLSMRISSLFF